MKNNRYLSQKGNVLAYLRKNALTPIDALNLFGCFRLAAVIFDLRKEGYLIITETIRKNGKRFARYKLVEQ